MQDSESRVRGDSSGVIFCGPRSYSIVGDLPYIQLNEETREITLMTDSNDDIGLHVIELQITLLEFPSVTKVVQFEAVVNPCQILDYSASIDAVSASYTVHETAIDAFAYSFLQTNSCGYPETITVDNPATDFITHNGERQDFTI